MHTLWDPVSASTSRQAPVRVHPVNAMPVLEQSSNGFPYTFLAEAATPDRLWVANRRNAETRNIIILVQRFGIESYFLEAGLVITQLTQAVAQINHSYGKQIAAESAARTKMNDGFLPCTQKEMGIGSFIQRPKKQSHACPYVLLHAIDNSYEDNNIM